MAETRVLAPVLSLVEQAGGKAVLVGDPAQLPAVGAGGLYARPLRAPRSRAPGREPPPARAGRARRVGAPPLRRRRGLPRPRRPGRGACSSPTTPPRPSSGSSPTGGGAAEGDLRESVMLAHRRADVRDLNEGARALLRQAGRLGERALVAGDREFRPGDRVVCRHNDPALGVRNGTRGSVRDVDAVLGIVTVQLDGGPSASSRPAMPPSTSSTATPSPATPPRGRASSGRSSWCAPKGRSPNGATSPPPAPGPRRGSTRSDPSSPPTPGSARDEPEATTRRLAAALSRTAAEPPALERLATAGPANARSPASRLRRRRARPRARRASSPRARPPSRRAGDGRPARPGAELRQLHEQRTRLGADLARAEAERERAERARAAIGRVRMVGRAGQEEAARHERAAAKAAIRAQEITARLADSGRRART